MSRSHPQPAFSVLKLLRREPDQIIRPDVTVSDIGRALGPPSWWDFADDPSFTCLMDYQGNLQIALWSRGGRVEVRRIGLRLWYVQNGEPKAKSAKLSYDRRRLVRLDGFVPGASIDDVRSLLDNAGMSYEENSVQDASEVVARLTVGRNSELLFFMMDGRPSLAEIQCRSRYRGA